MLRSFALVCLFLFANACFAVDGDMGIVTGSPGKIMDGAKVIADVPTGTRLWLFSTKPGWAEVKVPSKEQRGWMSDKSIEKIILTDEQKKSKREAFEHYEQYKKLNGEENYQAARKSLESCLKLERMIFTDIHPNVADSLRILGDLASNQQDYPTAQKFNEEALSIQRKILGNEHADTEATLDKLGSIASNQDDYKASKKYYEEVLAIRRKALGNESLDTASTLSNLGYVNVLQGDFPAARKYYEEALAIRRKISGDAHAETADLLNSLGFVALCQDDFPASRKYYEEALAIRRKVLGNDHADTAKTLHNLGSVAEDQKDYLAAKKYYDEALSMRRRVLGNDHADTVKTLLYLASLARSRKDDSELTMRLEEILAIRRKTLGNYHPDTAATLHALGTVTDDQKLYPTAQKYYDEALAIRRKVLGNENIQTANTLHNLAIMAEDQKNYSAARKYYEEALLIKRKVLGNEDPETATALYLLGSVAEDQKDYPAARKYFEEALRVRRKVLGNKDSSTANTLIAFARVCYAQRDYANARKHFEEGLAIRRAIPGIDPSEIAATLRNLGLVTLEQGDNAASQKYYADALAFMKSDAGKDPLSEATALSNLGVVANRQGNLPAARKYYEEALALQRKILGSEHADFAGTLSNLGNLVSDQGDYLAAKKYYDEALTIQRKVLGNQHPNTAQTLNNIGTMLGQQGNHPASRKYFEEALAIYQKVHGNDHPLTSQTRSNLAISMKGEGDYASSLKSHEEALATFRKLHGNEHRDTAQALNMLGNLEKLQKNYPAAKKHCDEALAIYQKVLGKDHVDVTDPLNNLGDIARKQNDFKAGADFYDQARRIFRNHVQRTLPGLSENEQLTFLDRKYQENWAYHLSFGFSQKADVRTTGLSTTWLINGKAVAQESLAARGLLARDSTDPQLAPIIKQLNDVRQQLATLSLSTPKPDELVKHRATMAQLAAEEQRLSRSIAQTTGIDIAVQDWIELDRFRSAIPDDTVYVDFVKQEITDFESNSSSAPHYLVWIVPSSQQKKIQILDLGDAAKIDKAVEKARSALATAANPKGELDRIGETALTKQVNVDLQAISDLVFKPLKPHLDQAKTLVLSPDGELWLLPWSALPIDQERSLLESYSLRYVLSGRDLLKSAESKLSTTGPAIFADPDFDLNDEGAKAALKTLSPNRKFDDQSTRGFLNQSSLPRVKALPYTAIEGEIADPLLSQLAGLDSLVYRQDQALEGMAKSLLRPKQLMFATHGFFLPDKKVVQQKTNSQPDQSDKRSLSVPTTDGNPVENPLLRCGLLLAGCNAKRSAGLDDGILTGLEIVGMDLRGTELVVLSACETGVGKVQNGEGVAGLRQAFQLAGAKTVVSTLWQVPDRDSALIMRDFLTNLAAGQTKPDALRNAQLARITERKDRFGAAHPFFWAAWTVTGE